MLLPVGHDNTQLTRLTVYRVLVSVHWPEVEHRCFSHPILKRRNHQRQILRSRPSSQWELSPYAGMACHVRHLFYTSCLGRECHYVWICCGSDVLGLETESLVAITVDFGNRDRSLLTSDRCSRPSPPGHRCHRPSMGVSTGLNSRHISHIFGAPFESCFVPITSNPCRR